LNEPLAKCNSERFIFSNREAEETRQELALKSFAAKVTSLKKRYLMIKEYAIGLTPIMWLMTSLQILQHYRMKSRFKLELKFKASATCSDSVLRVRNQRLYSNASLNYGDTF